MPLTDTQIKNFKSTGEPQKHFDGGGLYRLSRQTCQWEPSGAGLAVLFTGRTGNLGTCRWRGGPY